MVSVSLEPAVPVPAIPANPGAAHEALQAGRAHDISGRLRDAAACYSHAARLAEAPEDRPLLIEALRRLGVVRHRCSEPDRGRELCALSYREAVEFGDLILAGEALNVLAAFAFEAGEIAAARGGFVNALALAGGSPSLLGRIEQNLGVLDSVQGDHDGALAHYRRALEAFRQAEDVRGCAITHHNIGLVASRRGQLDLAESSYATSASLAGRIGDQYLGALCDLHRAEVSHTRRRLPEALHRAESALAVFELLGDVRARSDANKVIGAILRDCGRFALAEERLETAKRLAEGTGWVLGRAAASRELAQLHQGTGQTETALLQLQEAQSLYAQLGAHLDTREIAQRITELEAA